jgi:hypothetical protein
MTNKWNGSRVMEEYAKIASEDGLVSGFLAPKKDQHPGVGNPQEEPSSTTRNEKTEDYEVTQGTGADLVEQAHPSDAVTAEAMGDGALVENIVQKQKKDIEVATRMPHGMLLGRHAADLAKGLTVIANILDEAGDVKAAERVDNTLRRIGKLPFNRGFRKEALGLLAIVGLIATGLGALAAGAQYLLPKLTSIQEDLSTDIKDVIEITDKVVSSDPSTSSIGNLLRSTLAPWEYKFTDPIPAPNEKGKIARLLSRLSRFGGKVIPKIKKLSSAMTVQKPSEMFGPLSKGRMTEKVKDMEASYHTMLSTLRKVIGAGKVEKGIVPSVVSGGVKGVQELLNSRGIKVPVTGHIDNETRQALRMLESQLEMSLSSFLKEKGLKVRDMILRPDGKVMDVETLRRLLTTADRAISAGIK